MPDIVSKDSAFTKLFTLNVQRVFNLTQKCLPLLRAGASSSGKDGDSWKDPARIINVSRPELRCRERITDFDLPIDWLGGGSDGTHARNFRLFRVKGNGLGTHNAHRS